MNDIELIMISNVDWSISKKTKKSLLKYASDLRVIFCVGDNWLDNSNSCDCESDIFLHKNIEEKIQSNSVYILDDDDELLCTPKSLKKGFNACFYGYRRNGKDFHMFRGDNIPLHGHQQCVYNTKWLKSAFKEAYSIGIRSVFSLFFIKKLLYEGNYYISSDVIVNISPNVRTDSCIRYIKSHKKSIKMIEDYFSC